MKKWGDGSPHTASAAIGRTFLLLHGPPSFEPTEGPTVQTVVSGTDKNYNIASGREEMKQDERIQCWFCGAQFELSESECCTHTMPTPVCPYCLNCFCTAPEEQRQAIRQRMEHSKDSSEHQKHILFSKPLGSILLESHLISQTDLDKALLYQKTCPAPLGEIVVKLGLVPPEKMRIVLLNQQWIDQIDLDNIIVDLRLVERFGFEFCLRHQILPIELLLVKDHAILRVAISRRETLDAIRAHPAFQTFGLLPYLASADQISELLKKIKTSKS